MLLLTLFLSMMLPAYSAPENGKKETLRTDIKCPKCGKKVDLERELKKLEKENKKKTKKNKKKKDKKKVKDQEENKDKKDAVVKAIKCPKCKKNIPLMQPANDKKADAGNTEAPKDENNEAEIKDNE